MLGILLFKFCYSFAFPKPIGLKHFLNSIEFFFS